MNKITKKAIIQANKIIIYLERLIIQVNDETSINSINETIFILKSLIEYYQTDSD